MFGRFLLLGVWFAVADCWLMRHHDKPSPSIEDLVAAADASVPRLNYESLAVKHLNFFRRKSAQAPRGQGYLCTTFVKWSGMAKQILLENLHHTSTFCDWAIVVYNPVNHTQSEIEKAIARHVNVTFRVIMVDKRHQLQDATVSLCEQYYSNNSQYLTGTDSSSYPRSTSTTPVHHAHSLRANARHGVSAFIDEKDITNPCQLASVGSREKVPINTALYSKIGMLVYLLPLLSEYAHVWVLDGDLSLHNIDMNWFARIHQCAFTNSPLVAQPPIEEPTQGYQYLQRYAWTNPNVLASSVGFVEIQAPIFDSLFLEWFLLAFVVPLSPALHVLGVDWGFDEMFCTAAREFVARVGLPRYNHTHADRHHVCAVLLSDMTVNHRDSGEIGRALGQNFKLQLNFGLMKIVHRCFGSFANNGLLPHQNPFPAGNGFLQIHRFRPHCQANL